MEYPQLTRLSAVLIQQYERYLPSAFDESMSILQKLNKIIEFMNQTGDLVNSSVDLIELAIQTQDADLIQMNKEIDDFRVEITDDLLPLNLDVTLSDWFANGKLASIINQQVFTKINDDIALRAIKGQIVSSHMKILNDSDRLGLENLKQEVVQAMTGTTPVNMIPAYKSVTPKTTSFFMFGKNLFNKDAIELGMVVNEGTGELYQNPSYVASDYIEIDSSETYTETTSLYHAYYDSQKVFVSGLTASPNGVEGRTFTSPANAKYIRVTTFDVPYSTNKNYSNYQLEKGSVSTSFEEYNFFIPKEMVEEKEFNVDAIPPYSIDSIQTNFITTGKNLFDVNSATLNQYVNWDNGTLGGNVLYATSDFIKVDEDDSYTTNYQLRSNAYYDENKSFISGLSLPPITGDVPANATYVRISPYIENINDIQFEKGSQPSLYESFGYQLVNQLEKNSEQNNIDEVLVYLPSEICVAVGRTIELYNNQVVWAGNMDNYHVKWDCLKFKAMKRKFSITATTALIGSYTLTLTVYNNNMDAVGFATTTIKVVPEIIPNAKTVLTIGDSLTNSKQWLPELKILSGDKFTMIGTRGVDVIGKHEGRSGWSGELYLSGASYVYEGEGVNPFWDGVRFNWNHYKSTTGLDPSAIQIFLGTNGMLIDPTINATNIKRIVDYIRQDDPSVPIFIVNTLYRGNQDGMGNEIGVDGYAYSKGNWKLEEDRKVFNLMVRLDELLSEYTNLHFVPIAITHDSEYNFGSVSTPVNPRASQTENLASEATHPQVQGYLQFADSMFSTMAKVFS